MDAVDNTGHAMRSANTMMTDNGGGFDDDFRYYHELQNAHDLLAQTSFSEYESESGKKDVLAQLDITNEKNREKLCDGNTAYYYSILVAEASQKYANEHSGYEPLTAEHAYDELQGHLLGYAFSISNCDTIDLNQSECRWHIRLAMFICRIIGP